MIASLVLPTFGGMAFSMPAQPCPMQSADHQGHATADAPCCEQMDTSDGVANKSPCKSGQECKTGGLLQTTVIKSISPLPSRPEILLTQSVIKSISPLPSRPEILLTQSVIKREPAGLWRPPRFV